MERPALTSPIDGSIEGPADGRVVRGFSLVEAVVALAVLGLGLALVGSILIEAHGMLARAGVEARSPAADLVLTRLRSELQSAADVADPVLRGRPGSGGDPLELIFPDERRVRYEHRGRELVRRELVPAAGPTERGEKDRGRRRREWSEPRRVLEDVVSWRWSRAGTRLVTIEISYRSPGSGDGAFEPARPGPGDGDGGTEVRRTLVTALRGGGLGWGW